MDINDIFHEYKQAQSIRILPHDKGTFPTRESLNAFLTGRLIDRGGTYFYPKKSMASSLPTLVLFQYNGGIVGSAMMRNKVAIHCYDEDGIKYSGRYEFDVGTILLFDDPITLAEIQAVDDRVTSFSRAMWEINLTAMDKLISLISLKAKYKVSTGKKDSEKKTPKEKQSPKKNVIFPDSDIPIEHFEGAVTTVEVNKYERSPEARRECINLYGARCLICGLDFEEEYGELGKGFIHVHHLVPISKINKEYKVDYKKDLIPVCPNCHAMLHREINGKTPTPEELRAIVSNRGKK
jgi:hypothetical protein